MGSRLQVGTPRSLDEYLHGHFRQRRFQVDVAGAFAGVALCLAAIGVYGAMAFSVVQRRRELAIRTALGAQRRQLAGLVLARGARVALLGAALGVLASLFTSRLLAALLYGVGPHDFATLVAVSCSVQSRWRPA